MRHSQKISETPVQAWVAVEQVGVVVCAYIADCTKNHTDFSVLPCGLIITSIFDCNSRRTINCTSCGFGVLEIKSPLENFLEATADPRFYLEEQNGKLGLKTDHAYYYQLQAQMSYSGAKYGDFVFWSQNEIVKRMYLDETFISSILPKV